jgi:hypothetical protein
MFTRDVNRDGKQSKMQFYRVEFNLPERIAYLPASYVDAWYSGNELHLTGLPKTMLLQRAVGEFQELFCKKGEPVLSDKDGTPLLNEDDSIRTYSTSHYRLREVNLNVSDDFLMSFANLTMKATTKARAKAAVLAEFSGKSMFATSSTTRQESTQSAPDKVAKVDDTEEELTPEQLAELENDSQAE